MRDFTDLFLEHIRRTSTDLSPDVEDALRTGRDREDEGSAARSVMETILENVHLARDKSSPVCQDTGTPIFYVHHPVGMSSRILKEQIRNAIALATAKAYLRPNAVDAVSGVNSGNNLGDEAFPTLHFEEVDQEAISVDLILKGGGSENVSAQYSLPDGRLGAGRDLKGVRKAVLDAVFQAQGNGCAPGILGVAIGGDRGSSYYGAKQALLRSLGDKNPDPELARLEDQLMEEANRLRIGPMGFGGKITLLAVKVKGMHRLPACYFVTVAYMCWAHRRRRMIIHGDDVIYQ